MTKILRVIAVLILGTTLAILLIPAWLAQRTVKA